MTKRLAIQYLLAGIVIATVWTLVAIVIKDIEGLHHGISTVESGCHSLLLSHNRNTYLYCHVVG